MQGFDEVSRRNIIANMIENDPELRLAGESIKNQAINAGLEKADLSEGIQAALEHILKYNMEQAEGA